MNGIAGSDPRVDFLAELPCRIGEIVITRSAGGGFDLRHRDDGERGDLIQHTEAVAAVEIARFDAEGKYRPLKTAPSLRRGWRLVLGCSDEVRLALDYFYPARIAAFLAHERGALRVTPLRETLARQTGMYRVAMRISDAEADELVGGLCRSEGGCLRTILWRRDAAGAPASTLLPAAKFDPGHDQTGRGEPTLPLLCQEACNLLVAAARHMAKSATQ